MEQRRQQIQKAEQVQTAQRYRMAAFDMDGTLLSSRLEITPGVRWALHEAAAAGKVLALNTGRNYSELREYLQVLPDVRYVNSISGAMVLDIETGETIYEATLPVEQVLALLELTKRYDVGVQLMTRENYVETHFMQDMRRYQMETFEAQFRANATVLDDLRAFYRAAPFPVNKVNIYHRNAAQRTRMKARIQAAGLEFTTKDALAGSLEVSPNGIHKGVGLEALARHLGISMDEVIVVGDWDNDRDALEVAGLPIAMGNAQPDIKAICKAEVADCDHDGCAEVVYRYLLA